MKIRHIIWMTLLISIFAWILITRPLALHIADAIPVGFTGGSDITPHFMMPGDHLQLLYHFWLLQDMIEGHTPWFYNLYEFHTGDDAARYQPTFMYLPFSLVYTLFSWVGGRAFGFNMAGLISIWLTYLFTWLWVRRYAPDDRIAGAASVLSILLPYRWFELMAGSPTGFAMTLVPLLLLLLDETVRRASIRASLGAGAVVWLCFAADLHVFFFASLMIPFACLLPYLHAGTWDTRTMLRTVRALAPAAVLSLSVVLYSKWSAVDLGGTDMEQGRSLIEVMSFSPQRIGFFSWQEHVIHSRVFIGFAWAALVALGLAAAVWSAFRSPRKHAVIHAVLFLLMAGAAGLIGLLAIGPHGPFGGRIFIIAREWIPHYEMIRQAGKIYCLMPPLVALLAAGALASLAPLLKQRMRLSLLVAIPITLIAAEYLRRYDAVITWIDHEEPAYAAAARDADQRNVTPHIMVVPLWPGDSHFASVYQFYASIYHMRMLNGYTPAVSKAYFNDIFLRYQSINQGWMTDDQADSLLEMGITHIMIHEDLFPEKVSPFPVGHTIQSLTDHPRLTLLAQSGPVWSFRIEQEAVLNETNPFFPLDAPLFSGRHWIFENVPFAGGEIRRDPTASREQYVHLHEENAFTSIGPTPCPPAPNLRWMIRARGHGVVRIESIADDRVVNVSTVTLHRDDWTWLEAPVPIQDYADIAVELDMQSGSIDLCSAHLTAGSHIRLEPGDELTLPASLFFHAGHILPHASSVQLRTRRERAGAVFYGPKLPMEYGDYTITLDSLSSDAPTDRALGTLHAEQLFTHTAVSPQPVWANQPTTLNWTVTNNLPVNIYFNYYAEYDMIIRGISIKRIK
jgi:hypothetical protein